MLLVLDYLSKESSLFMHTLIKYVLNFEHGDLSVSLSASVPLLQIFIDVQNLIACKIL